jgi:hypothetical protein
MSVMKAHCWGCPFDIGQEGTEMAYNLGCLPSTAEVATACRDAGQAWACHSTPKAVCCGYAEMFPDRVNLPLRIEEGVHSRA